MSTKYLGPAFDIHGGGLDLIFPHHENEVAQSRAAGDGFARYWLHNAMLNLSGEKMSKSLGNVLGVGELSERWRPVELRYYLGSAHYRSPMEFSDAAVDEAAAGYRRIENFVRRAAVTDGGGVVSTALVVPPAFVAAMDDDLGVPAALAVLHDTVREGNAALDSGDIGGYRDAAGGVVLMAQILGIAPTQWDPRGAVDLEPALGSLVDVALQQRQAARERKDFATSDAIRDQLTAAGIAVEDTPAGTRWTLAERS